MKKFCAILLFTILVHTNVNAQSYEDSMLNFIAKNPERASLHLVVNDTIVAALRENRKMPLASTMKLIVALEFAKQSAAGLVDTAKMVPLRDLDRYYIPLTDGNAHTQWLRYEKLRDHVKNDSIALIHVARGMMMFSSNANTDYLLQILGVENVQSNVSLLGLKQHDAIFPPVASLFLYQNPKNKKESDILRGIKSLSDNDYVKYILTIQKALAHSDELKKTFRLQDLTVPIQKMWSDRLPSSTAREYTQLANILNNRKYFSAATYTIFSRVTETIMENPANAGWLKHAGMKGGSTAWVLTKCIYATDANDNRIELAYFFNNLDTAEQTRLHKWMNDFERAVIANALFRNKLAVVLKKH